MWEGDSPYEPRWTPSLCLFAGPRGFRISQREPLNPQDLLVKGAGHVWSSPGVSTGRKGHSARSQ